MASLSATEKKITGNRFRSDSDAVTLTETAANPLRDYILESARTIHRTELTMAFLRWMLSMVAVFFSLVLIDQWLWPLSITARYVVWVGFISGTVLWFTTMVLPLIGRTIHPHYAARQIETTLPEMKEGLITWVQLSGSDSPPPKSVLNAVGRYVAKQLKGQDIASVIDQLNPLKLAAALMGLTLIGAIYLATSPKNVPATIQRLLMPWANIAPATRVQIVSVVPGNTSVIQGSNASIAIQVRGWQRQDKANIRYSTDDGQTVDQRIVMNSDIEGLSYRIELGKSFGGILQPMHYWVEAGDAIAGPFAIQVQAIPLSTLERVDYVYPAYTQMSPRTIESDGRIEGPEGTRVRVTARGNQPMKSARVEFDSTLAQDGSYQPEWIRDLQVDDRSISGDWILEVNEKRSNPSRYQYRIRSTNMLGESAPEPVVYPMTVVADMAPEVDFAAEIKDIIEVAENSSVALEMRANDPDFGLVKLVLDGTLIGSKNRGSVLQEMLVEDAVGLTGQSVHTLAVAPKQLGLQSGDTIDLVLTASDNRHDPQTSKPAPNIVKSRVVTLKVTPPVKNPNSNDDTSGGKQNKDASQSDTTPRSNPPSDPKQPNKKTSKENPEKSNEKPSGEQQSNKQDQAKQDQSKQAADPANGAQKDNSQRNKAQEKAPSQPKSTPNQPKDNAKDQSQDKDQPPRDQKQQPDNKKPEQQPRDSKAKDQSSKDQSGKDQGSGDGPSGASESSDSSEGQPQGSQKSAGGKSGGKSSESSGDVSNAPPNDAFGEPSGAQSQGAPGAGKESPIGSQSPDKKSDPSSPDDSQSSGSKADPSESNASDGDASDGQTPTHDGEAFERLQKILNQSNSKDGANGKSTRDQGPSDDKNEQTNDPQGANSGKPSSDQSKTNTSPEKTPDKSSSPDNATDQKSGDSSNRQSGNKQQPGNSNVPSNSSGNTSDPTSNDTQPSNQQNKSDTGKSDSLDDKSKANESNGGDKSKDATDNGNLNQSKTSPTNSPSGEESPSGQESKSNDSKANKSNSKQGRDNSESETPNNAKPEDSNAKNSQPESNKAESNQPNSPDSKSSDPAGSKSMSGQAGKKGASSEPSKQDATNSSSSKTNEGDPAKGDSSKSDPSKGDSKSSEGKSQDASSKRSQSEGSGQAKGSSGESKSFSGSSKSSGASLGGSQGMNSSGESGTTAGNGAGGKELSARSSEETTEYAKSATDLVLDSLKRQREQPDPELLERMGWSKEQMQAFVDRWQSARDQAMIDPSKKKDYEDMLQSLGLVPQTGSTRAVLGRTDSLSGIREEGSRVRPPESLRERFEAFRKASQKAEAK